MNAETLVTTMIVFPTLTGLACLIVPKALRKILIVILGIVMIGASLFIYNSQGFTYTPSKELELVVVGLDVVPIV